MVRSDFSLNCPLTGGCSEGLDAFRFFFKHKRLGGWVCTVAEMQTDSKWTAARAATCQLISDTCLVVGTQHTYIYATAVVHLP